MGIRLFGNTLYVIIIVLHLYVIWRATTVPLLRRRLRRRTIVAVGSALCVACILVRRFGRGWDGWAGAAAELAAMNWMGTILLLFLSVLAADLLTGFGLWLRRLAPPLRGYALCAGGLLAVVAMVQGLRPPVIVRYQVHLPGLPAELDGTTLVGMADLHLGRHLGARWLARRVAQVQALGPDAVVLLGDIFDHGRAGDDVMRGLESLSAPMGVWAVPGNHESFGRRRGAREMDQDTDIHVLRTRWAQLRPGLVLAGVEDLSRTRGDDGRAGAEIGKALAGRPQGATILLSHIPWGTRAADRAGVGLMLSGHTHGGQLWPLGYLSGIRYPLQGGRYQVGNMTAIVCRGTGTWGARMRLWWPAEIIHVTLRRAP